MVADYEGWNMTLKRDKMDQGESNGSTGDGRDEREDTTTVQSAGQGQVRGESGGVCVWSNLKNVLK